MGHCRGEGQEKPLISAPIANTSYQPSIRLAHVSMWRPSLRLDGVLSLAAASSIMQLRGSLAGRPIDTSAGPHASRAEVEEYAHQNV